jgi:hypothetical protein
VSHSLPAVAFAKGTAFPGCKIPQAIDVHDDNAGEPALWLVLKESEAKKIVASTEKGHAYEVIAILKSQPWWPELSAAVRGLKYKLP